MARGLDVSELQKYRDNLKNEVAKQGYSEFLKEFLIENAELIIGIAKNRTPVDTGALRATWGLGEARLQELAASGGLTQKNWNGEELQYKGQGLDIVDLSGNEMTVLIWNGMEYASHVEFGTPARPGWKWSKGAHMLTVAIDEVYRIMPERYKQRLAAWAAGRGL